MTSALFGGPARFRQSDAAQIYIKNNSEEDIPSHSFVKVEKVEQDSTSEIQVVTGNKPDGDTEAIYVVSGLAPIPRGITGNGYWIGSAPVWVDYHGTTPEPIIEVGPETDTWSATTDGTGYKCVGVRIASAEVGSRLLIINPGSGGPAARIVIATLSSLNIEADIDGAPVGSWQATVNYQHCDTDAPDTITVVDHMGCFFNGAPDEEDELIGSRVTAVKMIVHDAEDDDECEWVVISMCCVSDIF